MATGFIRIALFLTLPVSAALAAPQSGTTKTLLPGMNNIENFGGNPGNLAMQVYKPAKLPAGRVPLIVALHGCGGSAEHFSRAGFNELAEKFGFYVLYPEQKSENHPGLCFNHLLPDDPEPGEQEFDSVMQMIHYMVSRHRVSRRNISLTGFSSGGQVANILAATYPEIFKAVAIIGAGGYVCESGHKGIKNFVSCFGAKPTKKKRRYLTPGQDAGHWPRISIWHGKNDRNVPYTRVPLALKQWKRVHKLARKKPVTMSLAGDISYEAYKRGSGRALIEVHTMNSAAHTIPITAQCGKPGEYYSREKICFANQVVRFFGLKK